MVHFIYNVLTTSQKKKVEKNFSEQLERKSQCQCTPDNIPVKNNQEWTEPPQAIYPKPQGEADRCTENAG